MRTKEEVESVRLKVNPYEGSKFPGMTYEEGIEVALSWVSGDTEDFEIEGDPYFDPEY